MEEGEMPLSNHCENIISFYLNKCLSSTSITAKKTALQRKLDDLLRCADDAHAIDHLRSVLAPRHEFGAIIDQKSGIGSLSSAPSNTRIQLTALLGVLNGMRDSRLSPEVCGNITFVFDECIEHTSSDPKKTALREMKAHLLGMENDQAAIHYLEANMAADRPFGRSIDIKTGMGSLSGSPSNSRTQLEQLRLALNIHAPVQLLPRPLDSWMSGLDDDALLNQITMPGSHDAGVYNDPRDLANAPQKRGLNPTPLAWAICQKLSVYEQCKAGVRYFDIRVAKYDQAVWHATHDTGGIGAWGAKADKILDDLTRFIREQPTEVLFLKVTHTTDLLYIQHAIRKLSRYLYPDARTLEARHISIAEEKLRAVRGRILVIIENDSTYQGWDLVNHLGTDGHRYFPFTNIKKHEKDANSEPVVPAHSTELVIFGGNTGKSIQDMVHGQLDKACSHTRNPSNCLFQMSWTQMGGDIRSWAEKTDGEGGPHSTLQSLVACLRGADQTRLEDNATNTHFRSWRGGMLGRPNFVHMDFSCADSSRLIIELNHRWRRVVG